MMERDVPAQRGGPDEWPSGSSPLRGGGATAPAARRSLGDDYRRYLPITEADRAWGLFVTCGGQLSSAPEGCYPPSELPASYRQPWSSGRTLDEFQLHFITRGGGVFESEHGRFRHIEAGSVFILFPGTWHRYRPDAATGWDEWWIGFDGEQARRALRPPFFSSRQPVHECCERDALLEHFTAILSMLREDQPHMQRMLAGVTCKLLCTLQVRIAGRGVDDRSARILQEAKR
jgi:hypothetical protein